MGAAYSIDYREEVMRKHIPALSSSALIQRAIEERLMIDPNWPWKAFALQLKWLQKAKGGQLSYHLPN